MRRLIRFLKRLVFFILLLSASAYLLFATHLGTRLAMQLFASLLPGTVKIEKINGELASDLGLQNISFVNDAVQIHVKSLHFSWHPFYLLNKKMVFDTIDVEGIHCELMKKNEAKPAASSKDGIDLKQMMSFLSSITLNNLNVKDLSISHGKEILYQMKELSLTRQTDNSHKFNLVSSDGDLHGQFTLVTSPHLAWQIAMSGKGIDPKKVLTSAAKGNIDFVLTTAGIWAESDKKINLNITNLSGKLEEFPVSGFIDVAFANGKLRIQDSQLKIADTLIKIAGTLNNEWNLEWQLHIPKLETIVPNSKGSFESAGKVIGPEKMPIVEANIAAHDLAFENIKIKKIAGKLSSQLKSSLKKSSAKLILSIEDIAASDYHVPDVKLQIDSELRQHKLISNIEMAIASANQINGIITLPAFMTAQNWSQPVEGKLALHFTRLNAMIASPEIKDLKGSLHGAIDIAGTLDEPLFYAKAHINDGYVYIQKLRIALEAINLQSNYDPKQPMRVAGSFVAGKGRGELNGTIDLHQSGVPLAFKLNGTNLTLSNLTEYKIIVSPNLDFSYHDNKANVQGQVDIPFAEIKPKDFTNVTTLPSETVVIVDEKQKATPSSYPTNFQMNVKINLGSHIFLAYENLQTKLTGSLVISQDLASMPKAAGELRAIDGKYRAYGKLMTIKDGRLIYTGNALMNPGLDIRAVQQFKQLALESSDSKFNDASALESVYTGSSNLLTVGIWVKGTLNKPSVTFFSDPAGLSQSDILSYLVFGYPRSQIKTANKLALLNSLASGLYQGKTDAAGLTQKAQKAFGLSELTVGSTDYFDPKKNSANSATTVTVGKKIGRNLSLHYSVGLFSSVSIFNLRYQINKRLAIQSETSSMDTGADLVYEIEKD